jgi:hypothetical protein
VAATRPDAEPRAHAARPRPRDPAEALERFLARVATLDTDDIDRLACAEVAPDAFGATIARFLPPDQLAALQAMAVAVDAQLDPVAAARPGVRDAVESYGTELVLGPFLDELLSDPFRERAQERLTRGWDAAVGQPRYGPNGVSVRAPTRGSRASTVPGSSPWRRWRRAPAASRWTNRGRQGPHGTTMRRCACPRSSPDRTPGRDPGRRRAGGRDAARGARPPGWRICSCSATRSGRPPSPEWSHRGGPASCRRTTPALA